MGTQSILLFCGFRFINCAKMARNLSLISVWNVASWRWWFARCFIDWFLSHSCSTMSICDPFLVIPFENIINILIYKFQQDINLSRCIHAFLCFTIQTQSMLAFMIHVFWSDFFFSNLTRPPLIAQPPTQQNMSSKKWC